MSDRTQHPPGTSNMFIAFILGAMVVALMVVGYMVYSGAMPVPDDPDVRIELPGGTSIEGDIDRSGG